MKKYSHRILLCNLLLLLLSTLLCSCQAKPEDTAPTFDFTTLNFSNTYDDMVALEGDSTATYDSVYGGTTYTYPKAYQEHEGTIKYMFNEQNQLMSIAWACSFDNADDLYTLYDTIHTSVVSLHGESGYNTNKQTNYGDVWELEDYHIILSTMVTESNKALQFAYTKAEEETASTEKNIPSATD